MTWTDWKTVKGRGLNFKEITYEKHHHRELEGGIARVAFNRPEKYNTMTTKTVEMTTVETMTPSHSPRVSLSQEPGHPAASSERMRCLSSGSRRRSTMAAVPPWRDQ